MVQAANELDCELGGEVQEVNTSGNPEHTVVCGSLQSLSLRSVRLMTANHCIIPMVERVHCTVTAVAGFFSNEDKIQDYSDHTVGRGN